MSKADKIKNFDPNGFGLRNGHFLGLPFDEADANVVLLSVPWDVTVSFGAGTSTGPENILEASTQLDLYDPDVPDAWKIGLYMIPADPGWLARNHAFRGKASLLIEDLEDGEDLAASPHLQDILNEINNGCAELHEWVYQESKRLLKNGKLVGIVGGEHSVPLGYLRALGEEHESFGILQIDAHMDLRKAYEGFT